MNSTLAAIVERYARGEVSAQIATMELLLASKDVGVLTRALAVLSEAQAFAAYREQVLELSRWVSEHTDGCVTITEMLRTGLDIPDGAPIADVAIAQSRRLFDYSVSVSPESSVALYSLGSPELLAQLQGSEAPVARALDVEAARRSPVHAVTYNECSFRYALNEDAMATEKLAEGIRAFAADAAQLDKMIEALK